MELEDIIPDEMELLKNKTWTVGDKKIKILQKIPYKGYTKIENIIQMSKNDVNKYLKKKSERKV